MPDQDTGTQQALELAAEVATLKLQVAGLSALMGAMPLHRDNRPVDVAFRAFIADIKSIVMAPDKEIGKDHTIQLAEYMLGMDAISLKALVLVLQDETTPVRLSSAASLLLRCANEQQHDTATTMVPYLRAAVQSVCQVCCQYEMERMQRPDDARRANERALLDRDRAIWMMALEAERS